MKDKILKEKYKEIIIEKIKEIDDVDILVKILTFIKHT